MAGTACIPSCAAADTRACPHSSSLDSSTTTGVLNPYFLMLRASFASCFRLCSRALLGLILMLDNGSISNDMGCSPRLPRDGRIGIRSSTYEGGEIALPYSTSVLTG